MITGSNLVVWYMALDSVEEFGKGRGLDGGCVLRTGGSRPPVATRGALIESSVGPEINHHLPGSADRRGPAVDAGRRLTRR
jgi:hypothetical protein